MPTVHSVYSSVTTRLDAVYGRPEPRRQADLLDGLIGVLLSQHTTAANARAAHQRYRAAFATPAEALAAGIDAIEEAIRPAGLAPTRARRIEAILRAVEAGGGTEEFERLRDLPDDAVRERLLALPGIGSKSAACVLLFVLGRPEFPVDTHVHRLARRLGWIDDRTDAETAYRELRERVPAADQAALHLNLVRHGRLVCRARAPRCADCVLLEVCPTGEAVRACRS